MPGLCFYLYLLANSHPALTAPIPADQPPYISWRSEPNTRGTWTLLSNCVITLVLCVYTAVHLNVPAKDTSITDRYLCRAKWVLLGLLAPELVVYTAWRQWASAKQLTREMHELAKKAEKPNHPSFSEWTMMHSFFAEMGGYVIDLHRPGRPKYSTQKQVTVTAQGVLGITRLGFELPPITKAQIKDRSKADYVAKTLAFLQAGYMIIQEIGRLAFHLPITALEINTLGHVFCALVMFMFWLEKPLGIEEPVPLAGDWVEPLSALWVMRFYRTQYNIFGREVFEASELEALSGIHDHLRQAEQLRNNLLLAHSSEATRDSNSVELPTGNPSTSELSESDPSHGKHPLTVERIDSSISASYNGFSPPVLTEQQEGFASFPHKESFILVLIDVDPSLSANQVHERVEQCEMWSKYLSRIYCTSAKLKPDPPRTLFHLDYHSYAVVYLTLDGLVRWDLAWKAKEKYNVKNPGKSHVSLRTKNWASGSGHLTIGREAIAVTVIALVTALYGGLHALLWHSHFPTESERWLWRLASCIIGASGLVATPLIILLNMESDPLVTLLKRFKKPINAVLEALHISVVDGDDMVIVLLGAVSAVVALFYCASRVFLVVEAFISLRSLPPDAYVTPRWTQWLPHL